jgi:thiamine biosynthesis lipoprotein
MGTVVTFDIYEGRGKLHSKLGPFLEEAIEVLHEANRVFSTWIDDSPMSLVRRGELPVSKAPSVIGTVLDECDRARTLSRGWFDPWSLPGGVDPTGYVKGWAASQALKVFECANVGGAIINAAGDIASLGGPLAGEPFRFGITDPNNPHRLAGVMESPGAVATSGSYERGAHLYNPFTSDFITRTSSATVVGRDLGLADALATALCVGGMELMATIESLEGFEGLIIDANGVMSMTSRFPLVESYVF